MLYRMSQLFARAQVAQGIRVEQTLPDILAGEYENHLRLREAVASRDPNYARAEMRHHLEIAHGWEDQVNAALAIGEGGVRRGMTRLQGMIAIVTGAGDRNRRGHRPKFAEEGAIVCVTGRNQEQIEAVAAGIVAHGGDAFARLLDVRSSAQYETSSTS